MRRRAESRAADDRPSFACCFTVVRPKGILCGVVKPGGQQPTEDPTSCGITTICCSGDHADYQEKRCSARQSADEAVAELVHLHPHNIRSSKVDKLLRYYGFEDQFKYTYTTLLTFDKYYEDNKSISSITLIIFSVRDDVSIDSKMFLLTDFVNLKIKPAQYFRGAHRSRVYMCS
jgi:hypothetical protein